MSGEAPENINPALVDRIVQLDSVTPHPDNYNRHDIDALKGSLTINGQYRALVVDASTGYILAGNGTWTAAQALGWRRIAVDRVAVDETTARRILLVDNFSTTDDFDWAAVKSIIDELDGDLTGTGFAPDDYKTLLKRLEPEKEPDTDPKLDDDNQYVVLVECRDEAHQASLLGRFDAEGMTCRPFTM